MTLHLGAAAVAIKANAPVLELQRAGTTSAIRTACTTAAITSIVAASGSRNLVQAVVTNNLFPIAK